MTTSAATRSEYVSENGRLIETRFDFPDTTRDDMKRSAGERGTLTTRLVIRTAHNDKYQASAIRRVTAIVTASGATGQRERFDLRNNNDAPVIGSIGAHAPRFNRKALAAQHAEMVSRVTHPSVFASIAEWAKRENQEVAA